MTWRSRRLGGMSPARISQSRCAEARGAHRADTGNIGRSDCPFARKGGQSRSPGVVRCVLGMGLLLGGGACGGSKPPADPGGVPPSSILVASPPQGFSMDHLGAPYDANFELLPGKAGRTLFPKGERRTSMQNRLDTEVEVAREDRKSTRLNSSHSQISYAVFCLKK